MAINYTISYTFSPNTTISSSQVNTNFSDNANTWTGLEALTKSFARLKVDVDPTIALEVATKQYVDHYSAWRRPVLQYASAATVVIEAGLGGTSGSVPMLFPDGSVRTETSTTRTTFNITRNAVLTTSGAQSGLRATLSEATNTWYSLYAVKVTDSSTLWCTVGDTLIPTQGNFATLNTNFGTNGWVYLGCVPNGDNSGATGDIPKFQMSGNRVRFYNTLSTSVNAVAGLRLATTAGATTLTWSYGAGTALGSAQVPGHILVGDLMGIGESTGIPSFTDSAGAFSHFLINASTIGKFMLPATDVYLGLGAKLFLSNSVAAEIVLAGYIDGVLGVGSNPML